jgi:CRISPR/Cas system-associated endonuclease Cas3-HD
MMKSLSERIGERVRKTSPCAPHANRAIVLALRRDIRTALEDGWSVLAIYQTLHDEGKVSFSYQAFRRHVNRIIVNSAESRHGYSGITKTTRKSSQGTSGTGFNFNPKANKEDLI